MDYSQSKQQRIERVRRGELTDAEQRVLSVILRAKDGIHKRDVITKSLETYKTVEYVLCTLHAAGKIGQNGSRGEMARWCKPGLEAHCRKVAREQFYACREAEKDAKEQRKRELRRVRNKEYKARVKVSKNLPDTPLRIIGPAREFFAPGPISVFHLAK